jgi:methylaspartate ammonia-lyase
MITSLLTVTTPLPQNSADVLQPAPKASERSHVASERLPETDLLLVGVVVDEEAVTWATCWPGSPVMGRDELLKTVKEWIEPVLQGQPLSSFRKLARRLDGLQQPVTLTREIAAPAGPKKISRRAFFTGQVEPTHPSPSIEQVTIERPVDAALRYGISQALLGAVAHSQGMTIAEIVAKEYNLEETAAKLPPPLHVSAQLHLLSRAIVPEVRSLGYTTSGPSHKEALGDNAQRLQRWTRQMQARLAAGGVEPGLALHLDVGGGLGELYGHNPGKILGALYGLEQAAKPYPVRVVDPVLVDARTAQIEKMRELKEYLRLRKLNLQLVARAWVETLEDVRAFLAAEAVHMLQLDLYRLGSLHQGIEAIRACRQQGTGVLLAGHPLGLDQGLRVIHQVALATGVELLAVPGAEMGLQLLQRESARSQAWLAHRRRLAKIRSE